MNAFKQINVDAYDLNVIQDNIASFTQQLISNPLLDGQLLKNINVATGVNNIPHKLGRNYQGYLIAGQNAAITLYDVTTSGNKPKYLSLNASGGAVIQVWVF